MKYRRIPMMVDAVQWTGKNTSEVKAFLTSAFHRTSPEPGSVAVARFVLRRSSDMTKALWANIELPEWPDDVDAAVYDPIWGGYLPMRKGEYLACTTAGSISVHEAEAFKRDFEALDDNGQPMTYEVAVEHYGEECIE